jgi:hypothetical protein
VLRAGVDLADESVWATDPDPVKAVLLRVEGVGRFVRVLLPVHLTGGFAVTFGTWLEVADDATFAEVIDVWWAPQYEQLSLDGRLANDLPLWGLGGSPVTAGVLDPDSTPVILASSDESMQSVLTQSWPHERVLGALPG